MKKISYTEFLDTVKVLRMLYGVAVADKFFKKNFTTFTGYEISDLNKLKHVDTIGDNQSN